MEQEGCNRIGSEFVPLAAVLVGIKDEAFLAMPLEQNNPDGRPPFGIGRRQRRRLWVVRFTRSRPGEPLVEQLERVGRHLSRALGLASRIEQPIWSAMNDCGMGATWHSTFTNGWA